MYYLSLTYWIKYDILQVPPCWDQWQISSIFMTEVVLTVYTYITTLYLFLCWRTLRLLPHPGTYKSCFFEIGVRASLWTSVVVFSLGIYPVMELLIDRMVVLYFHFLEDLPCCSPQRLHDLDSPNSVCVFPFFHILTNICYLCFFFVVVDRHSDRYKVKSHCGCDLYFSDD